MKSGEEFRDGGVFEQRNRDDKKEIYEATRNQHKMIRVVSVDSWNCFG